MNYRFFSNGLQRYDFFLSLQIFSHFFSKKMHFFLKNVQFPLLFRPFAELWHNKTAFSGLEISAEPATFGYRNLRNYCYFCKDQINPIIYMEEKITQLPENAHRELKPGEEYQPLLSPKKNYPEVTVWSVTLGIIMTDRKSVV